MEHTFFVFLLILLIIHACEGKTDSNSQQWSVELTRTQICAVIGSSVVLPCTFIYPPGLTITKVYWMIDAKTMADIKGLPNYQGRVQYSWNKNNDCTLKLNKLNISDNGEYYTRIETIDSKQRLTSTSKVTLIIKELSLVAPEPVMEGKTVKLVCKNTCRSSDKVIWRKNGQNLQTNNNELILQKVSSDATGNYSCAIKPYEGHPSRPVELIVMFPPRPPSISVSPAGQTLEGATVTLSCSSDANPPVENYRWFKNSGSSVIELNNGEYYSVEKVTSDHTGYYYCEAKNKLGVSQPTDDFYLNVHYGPRNIPVSFNSSGEENGDATVTLSCSSDANPPVQNYTWYRRTGAETVHVGRGETITFTLTSANAGLYHCEAHNRVGSMNSTAVEVNWSGSGWWTAPLLSSLGFLTLLVLPIVFVFWRRKKSSPGTDSKIPENNVQCPDSSDPGDVQYASVQFKSSRGQQASSHSQKLKPSKPKQQQQQQQQEDVEYAAVSFSRHTAAIRSKKAKPSKDPRGAIKNTQAVPGDVQDNVTHLTFDPAQRVNSADRDEVQYSSVELKSCRGEEEPLYSTVQKPKPSKPQQQKNKQHQEAIEYAAVNVSKPTAATQLVE